MFSFENHSKVKPILLLIAVTDKNHDNISEKCMTNRQPPPKKGL